MALHIPPLQIARGIYTETPSLSWGEPAGAYIPHNVDSGTLETVWIGGRDRANHLVGGGLQDCNGEPAFSAPRGATVFDYLNQYIWVSNGWKADPYGLNQANNPTAFLGWTAFCSCINNQNQSSGSGSGSGSGTGGGGGGKIINACCPSGVASTLFLNISNACLTCLEGNQTLTWGGFDPVSGEYWQGGSSTNAITCNGTQYYLVLGLRCYNAVWQLGIYLSQSTPPPGFWANATIYQPTTAVCSPFDLAQTDGQPTSGNLGGLCGSNPFVSWSITD